MPNRTLRLTMMVAFIEPPTKIGPLSLILSDASYVLREMETVSGRVAAGQGPQYEINGPQSTHLSVIDVTWETGERDVRALLAEGTKAVRRLDTGALRMSVSPVPGQVLVWTELSQARIRPGAVDRRSSLKKATIGQLDCGAGLDVTRALREASAILIDSRDVVLGDTSGRRAYLCATFPVSRMHGPVVAFLLTRVLPLLNEYEG